MTQIPRITQATRITQMAHTQLTQIPHIQQTHVTQIAHATLPHIIQNIYTQKHISHK